MHIFYFSFFPLEFMLSQKCYFMFKIDFQTGSKQNFYILEKSDKEMEINNVSIILRCNSNSPAVIQLKSSWNGRSPKFLPSKK